MEYFISGIIVYALFFLLCYMGTGTDKKNMKSFYSYPDEVQKQIRENKELSGMIPEETGYVKSFISNFIMFLVVFLILGIIIRFESFAGTFLYFLVMGEGLNLFDFAIIDYCWWSRTSRTRFSGIGDAQIYHGIQKHLMSFLRAIPIFLCDALASALILQLF